MPSVSYIVPVWNKRDYLEECVNSIVRQNVADFEIIFIDDVSTDGSKDFLVSLNVPNSVILSNRANEGPGPTRNLGLSAATGTYVRFVDADDVLPDGSMQRLLSACAQSSCPAVRGNFALFDTLTPEKEVVVFPVGDSIGLPFWSNEGMTVPWLFQAYLFRRDYLEDNRHQFPDLRYGEDPVFLARFLCDAKIVDTISDLTYLCRSRIGRQIVYSHVHVADYHRHLEIVAEEFSRHGLQNLAEKYLRRGADDLRAMISTSDLPSEEVEIVKAKAARLIPTPVHVADTSEEVPC